MEIYYIWIFLISIQFICLSGIDIKLSLRKLKINIIRNTEKSTLALVLACFETIMLLGLRHSTIGADNYYKAVEAYKGISFTEIFVIPEQYLYKFEEGYFIFSRICSYLNIGENAFFFLVAIIIYTVVGYFIYAHTKHYFLAFLTCTAFLFSFNMFLVRQAFSACIIALGWNYIFERKFFKYLVIVLLATLFHTTALSAIVLYFFPNIKFNKIFPYFIIVVSSVILFGREIIVFIFSQFKFYSGYVSGKYDVESSGGYYIILALFFVLFMMYYWAYKRMDINKYLKNYILNFFAFIIILDLLGYHLGIFSRILRTYEFYFMIFLPGVLDLYFTGKTKFLLQIVVGVLLVSMTLYFIEKDLTLNPYKFYWE